MKKVNIRETNKELKKRSDPLGKLEKRIKELNNLILSGEYIRDFHTGELKGIKETVGAYEEFNHYLHKNHCSNCQIHYRIKKLLRLK